MKKKIIKTRNCHRMPSTGNYINIFQHTEKIKILNFVTVIAYNLLICSIYISKIYTYIYKISIYQYMKSQRKIN